MSINDSLLVFVLAQAVLYGTPLLYAALGEQLAERSGVLNLGVEGMMLVGAAMGFLVVQRLDARGLQQANYGYTGIVVAALARYNPFVVVAVAFLLGGLQYAGYTLQGADFPSGLVGMMQGIILFAMLGGELLVRYRVVIERSDSVRPAEATT